MTTHRRHFLRLCGIAGIGTLAGCTNSSVGDGTSMPTKTSIDATRQAKLVHKDRDQADEFGWSVAVSGDGTTAIVGAVGDGGPHSREMGTVEETSGHSTPRTEDGNGDSAGSAYVFEATGGSWSKQAKLLPDDGDSDDAFGSSVAVSRDGTRVLVGAFRDEDPNSDSAGSAYVFEATDESWSQQAKLTPDDGDSDDAFGRSVALSSDGTTALIGTDGEKGSNSEEAGSAYVFDVSGGSWSQQAKLLPDDGDNSDRFGYSVAVSSDGTTALVGACKDADPNGKWSGSAYVFDTSGGSWSQQAKLTPDDGDTDDAFGWSVALSGDGTTALVGAFGDEDPNGEQAGSAYVFEATDGSWDQQAKLSADNGTPEDWFGRSVAVSSDGTTALVGAENEIDIADPGEGMGTGSTYVFTATDGSWSQRATLTLDGDSGNSTPDDVDRGDQFGNSVAVSSDGTTALIGDRRDDFAAGAAYVFTL